MSHLKIKFKFADGQLVKLQEDRPEEAHTLDDVPTEFLREFVAWNDNYNGDYDHIDRFGLLGMVLDWYEVALSKELHDYCETHGLPQTSADELAIQIAGTNDHANEHVRWLNDFSNRWEEMVNLYHVLNR